MVVACSAQGKAQQKRPNPADSTLEYGKSRRQQQGSCRPEQCTCKVNLGSGGSRRGVCSRGSRSGWLAFVAAATAVAAAIAAMVATVATIASVAAVATMAAVTAVAAIAAVAAMMTVAVAAVATIAATAAIRAVEKQSGIGLAAAQQGHANQCYEKRDSEQNSAVHPGILQINLLVP